MPGSRRAQTDLPSSEPRRSFVTAGIYGLWGVMSAMLGLPTLGYLLGPSRSRSAPVWTEATDLEKLPVDLPQEVIFQRSRIDGWKAIKEKTSAWVWKKADGDVVAFGPLCPHLGCAYRFNSEKKEFNCPCHTSAFDLEGKVLGGPSQRPLDRYDVRVENGKLLLGEVHRSDEKRVS